MQRKALLQNALASAIGLSLLVVVELVLQLARVGPSDRLFILSHQDGEEVYTINRFAAHRFFPTRYLRYAPDRVRFPAQKPPNTVRIFVLGASTLLGFPNPPHTSFPHFLEQMLADRYPERRFEVLNCGITAVNTFCLLDFMREVVTYDPDLIIVYAGHNEFIGPYGITTPFLKFGNNRRFIRFHMRLQRSKVHYYLKEALYRLGQRRHSVAADEAFGMHLFDKEIGLLDKGYQTTADNYRKNLEEMLQTAGRYGVPVLLATLVSNLKDFHPLRSECDSYGLQQVLEALLEQGGLQEAEAICRNVLNTAPYCANIHFMLGRIHYRRGEYPEALKAFTYARDMDRLVFRAPTVFNQLIRTLTEKGGRQVLLGDVEATFMSASPEGLMGNELITEHVHPTVYGHYLIALTLGQKLARSPLAANWGAFHPHALKSYDDYALQLGYSRPERISYRNNLILFLRKMPYQTPPTILRSHVAELIHQQLREISQLEGMERQLFIRRGVLTFLAQMLDFLLPEDRQRLERMIAKVKSES